MTWVATAALGLAALVLVFLSASLRWQHRAHERERQAWTIERGTLVNQLCHLVGKPWMLPRPADGTILPRLEDPDAEYAFIGDPDQLPDWE